MNLAFVQQIGPAHVGEQELWLVYGAGPSAYSQTTGDPVLGPAVGEYMGAPAGNAYTPDGLYEVSFIPSVVPSLRPSWTARWFFANTNGGAGVAKVAQNAAGTGMTPGTYPITFSGGTGSGAAGTVTVSATTVTAVAITNPGSYTVAPTAAIGGTPGGTPATLTVTLSTPGQEVPNGANLSAEQVQFMAIGGQL